MDSSKQILIIISVVGLVVFASSLVMIVGNPRTVILVVAGLISMVLAYIYPRLGLWLFLIYLPFGGTITYAIGDVYRAVGGRVTYTITTPLFHLAKDAVYIPALIAIVVATQTFQKLQVVAKPLIFAIVGLLAACSLTMLFVNLPQHLENPSSRSLVLGAIGLKFLIGYIPLLLCGYYLIRSKVDLVVLNRSFVILTLICCGLCWVQYWFLISGVCPGNSGLPDPTSTRATLLARCFVGGSLLYNPAKGLVRLPGTFVAPWQWAWFLIANSFFVYGASLSDPLRRWRWLGWSAVGTIFATIFISGQRASFLCVPLIFLVLFILTESNKKQSAIKLGAIALLGIIAFYNIDLVRREAIDFVGRWKYSPPPQFIYDQFQSVISRQNGLLGEGVGLATNAARRFGNTELIETFYAKVLYEIGWLGLLAFLIVVSVLTAIAFWSYRSLQKPSLRGLAICWWLFILFISYNTYYYPLTVDPVAIYYWFIGGAILRLPELERLEEEQSEIEYLTPNEEADEDLKSK